MSKLEAQLEFQMKAAKLPKPEKEYRFDHERLWRFDFAFPELKIAMECEGGTWAKQAGRHNRAKGFRDDCVKYNAAAIQGWMVLRFTSDMISNGTALCIVESAIQAANDREEGYV